MKKGLQVAALALLGSALMLFSLTSCSKGSGVTYTPGVYEGTGKGNNGDVTVKVTVTKNKITAVDVTQHSETPGLSDKPIAEIPAAIVKEQSLDVDVISGASHTSKAILEATEAALVKAGADVALLKKNGKKTAAVPGKDEDKTADVVIIGGGGAGLAAAVSAAGKGASVIVIEKMGVVGGNTIICGGIYNCPDPELQKPAGIEDSVALYEKQTWEGGDKVAKKELVDVLCSNAYDGLQWLKSLGMKFSDKISQGAGSLYPRTHTSLDRMGTGYIKAYMDYIRKNDKIQLFTSTKGDSLITDSTGRVTGVNATKADGGKLTLHADKGVIIATGGFAANVEMRQKYNTSGKWADLGPQVKTTNAPGITGDGIIMAEAIGANLVDMEQIQLLYLGNLKDGGLTHYPPRDVNGTDQIVFINKEGKRFVREDGRRDVISSAILKQTDGMMYILESGDGDAVPLDTMKTADGEPIRNAEKEGYVLIADTIPEMAQKIGCDAQTLQATIDTFNKSVSAKKDGFGRQLYSTKLTKGPWIACPRIPCVHHTMGGVQIDTKCHVINKSGSIIPGLYAAGEVTGGIHGANRLGGNAVVDTVVFGKLSGESAAEGI